MTPRAAQSSIIWGFKRIQVMAEVSSDFKCPYANFNKESVQFF